MSSNDEAKELIATVLSNINVTIPELKCIENSIELNNNVCNIQYEPASIDYNISTSYNPVAYIDAKAYVDTPYNNECLFASKFENLIERGKYFISFWYTYRSISKAIPEVVVEASSATSSSISTKQNEIDQKVIEILAPNMANIKSIALYITECGETINKYFTSVGYVHKTITDPLPSDTILNLLLSLFDVLITLDIIKERKTSFLIDFMRYKKAYGSKLNSIVIMEEMNIILGFLYNSGKIVYNFIYNTIKDQMKRVVGHEDFVISIIEFILKQIDDDNYILPSNFYAYIRCLPYFFILLDGPAEDIKSNIFQTKRLKLSSIQKLFKKYPIVPVYGDLCLQLNTVLEMAPHYSKVTLASSYGDSLDNKYVLQEYAVATNWKKMRDEHVKYASQMQLVINKINLSSELVTSTSSTSYSPTNTPHPTKNTTPRSNDLNTNILSTTQTKKSASAVLASTNYIYDPIFQKSLEVKNIEFSAQVFDSLLNAMKAIGRWKINLLQILAFRLSKFSNCHAVGGCTTLPDALVYLANSKLNSEGQRVVNAPKSTVTGTGTGTGTGSASSGGNGMNIKTTSIASVASKSSYSSSDSLSIDDNRPTADLYSIYPEASESGLNPLAATTSASFSSPRMHSQTTPTKSATKMTAADRFSADQAALKAAAPTAIQRVTTLPFANRNGPSPAELATAQAIAAAQKAVQIDGYEYDQALRQSFNKEELSIVIDMIGLLKSLSSLLVRYEAALIPILRFYMHYMIEQLAIGDLLPLLHRVDKRSKTTDVNAILSLRTLAADWVYGVDPGSVDYKDYSRRKGAIDKSSIKYNTRVVGASATQLYLFRAYLKHIYNENSALRQKKSFFSSAEIESNDIKNFENFYHTSNYFGNILNYGQHLKNELTDLSFLWYREQYLEVTKCIQFPIEISFPWILVDHILSNKDTQADIPMIENLVYILDIYNDSAQKALFTYNQQHLYDEVEAEGNLVLDQLIFILSDEIYNYYKSIAVTVSLDKSLKHKLEELKQTPYLSVTCRRFDIIATQRDINLLGRTINFNYLTGQHILKKFMIDMEVIVKKFESCSIECGLIELRTNLLIFKKLHHLLKEVYEFDAFDAIMNDIDEKIMSNTSYRGRITTHIIRSISQDIYYNYSYNYHTQRFVKSPISIRPVDYAKPPKHTAVQSLYGPATHKIYELMTKLTKNFFGKCHYEALFDLSQFFEISSLIIESMGLLTIKIKDIADYADALKDGLSSLKLPKYHFKSYGNYNFFLNKLKTLVDTAGDNSIKTDIFQSFRVVGNIIAFLKDLSDLVDIHDQYRFLVASSLLGLNKRGQVNGNGTGQNGLGGSSHNHNNYNTSNQSNGHHNQVSDDDNDDVIVTRIPNNIITDDILAQTPIGHVLLSLVHYSNKLSDTNNILKYSKFFTSSAIVERFPDIAKSLTNALVQTAEYNTIFQFALQQVRDTMIHFNLNKAWASRSVQYEAFYDVTNHPDTGIKLICTPTPYVGICSDNEQGFYKLWSALHFLYCMPEQDGKSMSVSPGHLVRDEVEFGHGFSLSGALFLHLLGQKQIFELYDYSYHIINIAAHENLQPFPLDKDTSKAASKTTSAMKQQSNSKGIDKYLLKATEGFVETAYEQKQLYSELFALYESKLPVVMERVQLDPPQSKAILDVTKQGLDKHNYLLYRPSVDM